MTSSPRPTSPAAHVVALLPTTGATPGALPATLTRVRGGTYSPTVDTVHFADGTAARTDLVRLSPNVDAYSIQFDGVSPRQLAHYRAASWDDATAPADPTVAAATSAVLHHSFPARTLTELSETVRRSGHALGAADLREHEAIAATQAAIWHFTDGRHLDRRDAGQPERIRSDIGTAEIEETGAVTWHGSLEAGAPVYLEFQMDGAPQLDSYELALAGHRDYPKLSIHLERSADGSRWQRVGSSAQTVAGGTRLFPEQIVKSLGAGATIGSTTARPGHDGYRSYRLVIAADQASRRSVSIGVRLRASGAGVRRNSERILALYDYLLEAAKSADSGTARVAGPQVVHLDAAEDHILGPFLHDGPAGSRVAVRGGHAVDADGHRITGPVGAGTSFYVRIAAEVPRGAATLRIVGRGASGQALLGSRTHGGPAEFTALVAAHQPPAVLAEHTVRWTVGVPRLVAVVG